MSKKCFDEFTNTTGRILDDAEKELLQIKVKSNKDKLKIEGKNLDTIVDGENTALQQTVKREFQIKTKNEVDRTIRKLSTETQLKTRLEELDAVAKKIQDSDKRISKQKAYQRAFISLIYNTNDTTDIPFEQIEKTLFKNTFGEFLAKVRKRIDEDPINFIQNETNFNDMLTEFFVFFRDPNNVNSVTKNKKAFAMAQEFFNAKYKLFERRKQNGDNNILLDQNIKVRWSSSKIKKLKRDEFIKELSDNFR